MIDHARRRRGLLPALAVLFVLAVSAAPGGRELLLKAPVPAPPAALAALEAGGGAVVQELRSCLLLRARPELASRLRAAGLAVRPLTRVTAGEYFLLNLPGGRPLPAAIPGARCFALEPGTWLLETDGPGFRARLAQPYRLKALRLEGVLPIPPPPAAERMQAAPGAAAVIDRLAAAVSRDRLRADIQALQDFRTRYASTPECEAAGGFLRDRFQEMGLAAVLQPFAFYGYQSRNVWAVIPGLTEPGQKVVVVAHYDSTSDQPRVLAPGADDNASGTAAVLELARLLAEERFDFSIVLLCVSAEEWGLFGSRDYAVQARERGDDIVGAISLDMISYPDPAGYVVDLYGNSASEWLVDRFIAAAQPRARLRLDKVINPSMVYSDHAPFWEQGYPALCANEDSASPYYHTTGDTLATLDMDFAVEATRAAVAATADLAQPIAWPAPPSGLEARSQAVNSLFMRRKSVYLSWQPSAGAAGYFIYRADSSRGAYARLTAQPVAATAYADLLLPPDRHYYYVVSAVDAEGREGNFSQEVRDDENN
jgi:hypothetical protein